MKVNVKLYDAIKASKDSAPKNNALLFMNKYVTYEEMIDNIDRVSAGLSQMGLREGDRITMAMPNIFEAIYAFYAANRLGLISHMVHPMTPVKQMARFMEKTHSNVIVILDTFFDHYHELLANENVRFILVNPTRSFSIVKQIGYALINLKKRKNIRYSPRVIRFSQLYKNIEIPAPSTIDSLVTTVYLHSGGTSGEPKTIELSNYAINALASRSMTILGETEFKDKHMLAVLPLFHGFGLCMGVHAMLCHGGVDTLMPKFDALQTIDLITKNQTNYVIGVPSLFENLLSQPQIRGAHLKNLHQAFVGGDYVAIDLKNRFDKLMKEYNSKARLLEGYGLTEVVTVCAVNTLKDRNPSSVGKPLPGIDIRIVSLEDRHFMEANELGEIVVSGDTMMNGYLEDESNKSVFLFDESGKKWVLTGDFGFVDNHGYVHFKQRLKRIVKVLGMPVLPSEIENLIMNFEEVKEVAAIGVPDKEKGNIIKLFVVTEKLLSVERMNEKIRSTIKAELSNYAVPKEIVYLEQLPKTIIGKIDTRQLENL